MNKNMGNVSGVIVEENGNAKTQEEKTEETRKKIIFKCLCLTCQLEKN